jgi:hypothetical protein
MIRLFRLGSFTLMAAAEGAIATYTSIGRHNRS